MAPPLKDVAFSYPTLTTLVQGCHENEGSFPWNSPHFYAAIRLSLQSVPEYRDEDYWDLWDCLEKDARFFVGASKSSWQDEHKLPFTKTLSQIFKSPKLDPLLHESSSTVNPTNELRMAVFVEFLLITIREVNKCKKKDVIASLKKEIDIVEKELKFLYMFLENNCNHEIDGFILIEEIKGVVDQAGSFLHSFFFTVDGKTELGVDDLLRKMKLVNSKFKLQCIANASKIYQPSPSMDPVVSPFVFHFLLHDLEDILNLKSDLIHDGVKEQIMTLYQELACLRSLILKDIGKQGSPGKLEGIMTRIRDVAYEAAEHIINLFLIQDTVELPNAVCRIKHLIMELAEEMKKITYSNIIDIEDFSEEIYLRTKRPPQKGQIDDVMVGFELEAIEILEKLTGGQECLQIISICGMPGLGKTTLAKQLFDNPSVVYRFDRRAWCVVSQTYQIRSMLIDILSSVTEFDREKILKMENHRLSEELYKSLKWRRYLIIMDDIWDINAWDDLRRSFPDDGNGSRIIFTSRRKDIALQASPGSSIHALPFLSEDQCWELLKKKVFKNQECLPELADIGMKIAALCQGIPLSVVVIAAVLAKTDKKESSWNQVALHMTSHINNDDQDQSCLNNILELSYKHLPEHLKLCFLYFGAFPEDAEIPVRKLISQWIAQGFVQKEEEDEYENLELLGQEYLEELIDRSLILVTKRKSRGGVKACSIHDLLHDLCFRISKKERFIDLIGKEFSVSSSLSSSTSNSIAFGLRIHSLLGFSPNNNNSFIAFHRLKLLRVLQLSDQSDLKGIGFLVHLRYLDLEYWPISICCLVNLQVLVVRKGGKFNEFLLRMPKLRILHFKSRIQFPHFLQNLPIETSNIIRSFSFLCMSRGKDENILKNFHHLRRLKCSFVVSKNSSGEFYGYPVIDFLTDLESLNVSLQGKVDWFYDVLSFPLNLRKLTLSRFKLSKDEVSKIGRLIKLEVLKLIHVTIEGKQWETSDGEFEELRFLKLDNLHVEEWDALSEHFPKLEHLVLRNCKLLKEIPSCLGDILTLQIIQVEMCRKSVADSAMRILEEQQEMGNEELKVIISSR